MSLIFALILIFTAALVAAGTIGHVVAENNMLRALLAVRGDQIHAARRSARREGRLAARAQRRAEFSEARERAATRAETFLRTREIILRAQVAELEGRVRSAEALLSVAVAEAEAEDGDSWEPSPEDGDSFDVPSSWGAGPDEVLDLIREVRARMDAGWWLDDEDDAPLRAVAS